MTSSCSSQKYHHWGHGQSTHVMVLCCFSQLCMNLRSSEPRFQLLKCRDGFSQSETRPRERLGGEWDTTLELPGTRLRNRTSYGKWPKRSEGPGREPSAGGVCSYFTGAWWEYQGLTPVGQPGPSLSQASGHVASAQSLGLLDRPGGLAWILWPWGLTAGRLHMLAEPGVWWMLRKCSFLPLGSERAITLKE